MTMSKEPTPGLGTLDEPLGAIKSRESTGDNPSAVVAPLPTTILGGMWSHFVSMTVILLVALYLVFTASNSNIPLSYDQAEYVGAARDFLETGSFLESTHSKSLGVLLPLGFPALIVLLVKITGVSPHQAALYINLFAGALAPLLVYLLVFRMTYSVIWSLWSGVAIASHGSWVEVSAKAMTDPLYSGLFTALVLLLLKQFGSSKFRSTVVFGLLGGIVVGSMYLLRISALFLIPSFPALWVLLNAWKKKMRWRDLALAVALFLALTLSVVAAVTWRFHQVNGGWSISPQVSFNAKMGAFKTGLNNDLWTLDDSSNLVIRQGNESATQEGPDESQKFLNNFVNNLLSNLLHIKRLLLPPDPIPGSYWLALSILIAICCFSLGWRRLAQALLMATPEEIEKTYTISSKGQSAGVGHMLALAQVAGLLLCAGVFFASARTELHIMVWFSVFVVFLSTWGAAFIQPVSNRKQKPDLLLGLTITGSLSCLHIFAYSFLNSQSRYMSQALPIASAFAMTLVFAVASASTSQSMVNRFLAFFRKSHIDSNYLEVVPRSRYLGCMAVLAIILLLSEIVMLQAKHTMAVAKTKQRITADLPNSTRDAGLLIKSLAQKQERPIRVLQGDSGVAYYAEGQGYMLPYLERRPDRLLQHLGVHKISYIASYPFVAFGEMFTGIGIHHLLSAMASGGYPGIINHKNGLVFQTQGQIGLKLLARGDSFPDEGIPLGGEGYHLFWLTVKREGALSPKDYKRINTEPRVLLNLSKGSDRIELPGNTLCPALSPVSVATDENGSKIFHANSNLDYYQLVSPFDGMATDNQSWRITLPSTTAKEFTPMSYALYSINP